MIRSVFIFCFLLLASNGSGDAQEIVDWDAFEKRSYNQLVQSVAQNPSAATYLELVDFQIDAIEKIAKKHVVSETRLRESQLLRRQNANLLIQEGKEKDGRKILDRMRAEKDKLRSEFSADIEHLLLPNQVQALKHVAKRMRLVRQSNTGDFFGIPLALTSELGLTNDNRIKFEKKLMQERDEYHETLRRLRSRLSTEVLASLPAKKRKFFKEKLGEIYDFKAEEKRVNDLYLKKD